MHKLTLKDGVKLGGSDDLHKEVQLRALRAKDIFAANEAAELPRLIMIGGVLEPVLLRSATVANKEALRRQIVKLGDIDGPLSLDVLGELTERDLDALMAAELGAAGNLDAGASVSLVSPVGGVDTLATVAAGGLTGGADVESDDLFRGRLLDRVQAPPQGGAAHDYIAWALEIDGVTRAWVFPSELGLGTVVVRFTTDDDPGGIIPSLGKADEVLAHIDPLRPVTAAVTVLPPVAVALDLTIQLTPNTATVQAAVEASLNDLLRREAIPGGTILLSHIREAISVAAGETNHVLVSPVADVTHQTGEIAVLGTVTWQ